MLGETLRAVVAQQLMPKIGGGRVAAMEILFALARHRQPDPRGQDAADHLGHPDRHQGRHDRHGLVDQEAVRREEDQRPRRGDKAIDKTQFKDLIESGATHSHA